MADPEVLAVALPDLAVVSITERRGVQDVAAALTRALGLVLPPPGKWHAANELRVVCTTPGQWLVVQAGDEGTLYDRLAAAAGEVTTLIDLSGAHIGVRVSGPGVREMLAKGLPLDLHPRAMRPGDAAATVAAHLPVLIWQDDDVPTYDLLCARSLAGSFTRWLELVGLTVRVSP